LYGIGLGSTCKGLNVLQQVVVMGLLLPSTVDLTSPQIGAAEIEHNLESFASNRLIAWDSDLPAKA
jgi:hypothetical protein